MCTCKTKFPAVYSYLDISFQCRNYTLRTRDSSHFSTMLPPSVGGVGCWWVMVVGGWWFWVGGGGGGVVEVGGGRWW